MSLSRPRFSTCLQDIRAQRKLTYVLVSHDLAVVSHMCDNVLVMNRGEVVESITKKQLQESAPKHEYTRQLLLASKGYDRSAIDQFKDF